MNTGAVHDLVARNGNVHLAVRVWGGGPSSVVLVHGHGTNLMCWLPLVATLERSFTVVSYDRRGHGRSSSGESYSVAELGADVGAVVDRLGLTGPILVGHSIGSWEVLTYAASEPNVTGVICLDQAIAVDDPVWQATYPTMAHADGRRSLLRTHSWLGDIPNPSSIN